MSDQRVRISLSDLPLRPRAISDSDLGRVFGGGCVNHSVCFSSRDCCGKTCYLFPNSDRGSCRPNVG
jgi:hypothetical protein